MASTAVAAYHDAPFIPDARRRVRFDHARGPGLMLTALTGLIGMAVVMTVPAFLVLQPFALIRLPGGWRIAALLPLLPAVPAAVFSAVAYAQESNLWPMAFILVAPIGTVYLAILLLLHRARTRP